MEQAAASPSCPRCGAPCSAGAARCAACGFAMIDAAEARKAGRGARLPRRAAVMAAAILATTALVVGGTVALVSLVTRADYASLDERLPARIVPLVPVSALEAERRLELRFGGTSDDETAAVRCPYRIEPRQIVRCELRYADGIVRAMLVRLTRHGELEAAIPYPATLRR